jgi:hypothetical protein
MTGLLISIGNLIGGSIMGGGTPPPVVTYFLLWKTPTDRMLISASGSDKLVWR